MEVTGIAEKAEQPNVFFASFFKDKTSFQGSLTQETRVKNVGKLPFVQGKVKREHLGELDIHKSFTHCCFSLNSTEGLDNMERCSSKELGGF